jgi:hypothetical protein
MTAPWHHHDCRHHAHHHHHHQSRCAHRAASHSLSRSLSAAAPPLRPASPPGAAPCDMHTCAAGRLCSQPGGRSFTESFRKRQRSIICTPVWVTHQASHSVVLDTDRPQHMPPMCLSQPGCQGTWLKGCAHTTGNGASPGQLLVWELWHWFTRVTLVLRSQPWPRPCRLHRCSTRAELQRSRRRRRRTGQFVPGRAHTDCTLVAARKQGRKEGVRSSPVCTRKFQLALTSSRSCYVMLMYQLLM